MCRECWKGDEKANEQNIGKRAKKYKEREKEVPSEMT